MNQSKEAIRILRRAGEQMDENIDLAETALALGAIDLPHIDLNPYREHLSALVEQVRAEGPAKKLDDRLRILRRVLVVQHKYHGDEDQYDDLRNANLIQVIDRRRGFPVALGVLYLHIAEKLGWPMTGLNFPGHFLLRLSATDGRVILDPFRAGQTCQPSALRKMLQARGGAEILPEHYAPASKRDVLLRLQNNVKRKLLEQDRLDPAISALQSMILIAPRRDELWRELGYLQAERGNLRSAITALEVVCDLSGEPVQTQQTEALLQQLRWRLN